MDLEQSLTPRRAGPLLVGVVLGALSGVVELAFLVVAGVLALVSQVHPRARRAVQRLVFAGAEALSRVEIKRLRLTGRVGGYDGGRAVRFLAVRWIVGVLGGMVVFLLVLGVGTTVALVWGWIRGDYLDDIPPDGWILVLFGVVGTVLLFLNVMGVLGVALLDQWVAARFLSQNPTELLERRIAELAQTRADIVAAVDQERRRIERDLHDGMQQRLVALAMLIGRARRGRSPELLDELLRQAQEESQHALDELREVAWQVYPTELDTHGLQEALTVVADRAGIPVKVTYGLAERPIAAVESAAYFVVREAVTNAAKHSGAEHVAVDVLCEGTMIVVRVQDDGCGGADPTGGGLSGLARRVAALDGRLRVHSPAGGPTTVTGELPCG
jgi:signal transduction histidine kinase